MKTSKRVGSDLKSVGTLLKYVKSVFANSPETHKSRVEFFAQVTPRKHGSAVGLSSVQRGSKSSPLLKSQAFVRLLLFKDTSPSGKAYGNREIFFRSFIVRVTSRLAHYHLRSGCISGSYFPSRIRCFSFGPPRRWVVVGRVSYLQTREEILQRTCRHQQQQRPCRGEFN